MICAVDIKMFLLQHFCDDEKITVGAFTETGKSLQFFVTGSSNALIKAQKILRSKVLYVAYESGSWKTGPFIVTCGNNIKEGGCLDVNVSIQPVENLDS